MLNIRDILVGRFSRSLYRRLDSLAAIREQRETLRRLARTAMNTKFGRDHGFVKIRSVEDFQQAVPLRTYEELFKAYWSATFPATAGTTWPDQAPYFALSSGTTAGTTKYLPVTREMLRSNQRAALTAMGSVYAKDAEAGIYGGKFLFLGGSTSLRDLGNGVLAGDLSGIAVNEAPPWLSRFTLPSREIAFMTDWEEKLSALVAEALSHRVTGISGVPSWVLLLFAEAKRQAGKATISEIWPDLRLIIHGGIKFDPYRELFHREIGDPGTMYLETYPASEGFIAFGPPGSAGLRLMQGHGIFFEFVPVEDLERETPARHWLETIEPGVNYAVVLTTCAGLWSYVIGDTVRFLSTRPPVLEFTGRTKYFLSAFGEHLISEEIEKAVTAAATEHSCTVIDFHVGPEFPVDASQPGFHRYIIATSGQRIREASFAGSIDRALCAFNEDYAAHRAGGISMQAPRVTVVDEGAFTAWMKDRGRLGGQHKVPRMDNSGMLTREILTWMESRGHIRTPRFGTTA